MENDEIKNVINNEFEENSEVKESTEGNILESENITDETNTELVKSDDANKKPTLLKKFLCSILDQSFILALSSILLIVFDFLIKFIGYMVVMPLGILLIIYFAMNCIYSPLLKNGRFKRTLGEKLFNM